MRLRESSSTVSVEVGGTVSSRWLSAPASAPKDEEIPLTPKVVFISVLWRYATPAPREPSGATLPSVAARIPGEPRTGQY